jgi:hypothetical protein
MLNTMSGMFGSDGYRKDFFVSPFQGFPDSSDFLMDGLHPSLRYLAPSGLMFFWY